ncbi:hypothetical protein [Halomonas stenophila]|uniref:DUF3037 domain-containing protein n=1 Tax=Halomonas stenophila TaxID=795312 RepID=A0A7W5HLI5_9GAMM|nr:hypothetical protein [Halomonas stenophila]MBB3232900.1 hypothetical protein [Halomonas stenophila]
MNTVNRLLEHLDDAPTASPAALTRGRWFNIRLKPDLMSGEQFNVGVGFIDHTETLHTRFTDDLSRLRCFYDDRIDIDDMGLLVEMAASQFDRAVFETQLAETVSPQLAFSSPGYAAGASVDDILQTFFDQTVSLVPPLTEQAQTKRPYFRGLNNDAVRHKLRDWMVHQHSELAKRLFPDDASITVRADDGGRTEEHIIDLPLRAPGQLAGSIVSAYCSSIQTAELRLLQSALSLNTAMRHLKNERYGMFVLRPDKDSGIDHKVLSRFDDMIDESVWKLHDAGVYVGIESSIPDLGNDIVKWAA